MEPVYVDATINDTPIRINKNDTLDIYTWRDYKIKPSHWFKRKPYIHIQKKSGYKRYDINIGKKHYVLSRVIYKAHNPDWDITDNSNNNFIDHINNNSLDNRIENLRILTNQQNQWNTNAKGYSWHKKKNKWLASIHFNGKQLYLGCFTEEKDARQAYLEAKKIYHIIA